MTEMNFHTPDRIDKRWRLTPTMKKVYARAIELLPALWIQGNYMIAKDKHDHQDYYDAAWHNGEIKVVGLCAVGGLQRAAWEVLGKPDMSDLTSSKVRDVEDLAARCERRTDLFAMAVEKDEEWRDPSSTIDFNDVYATSADDVVKLFKLAGNL